MIRYIVIRAAIFLVTFAVAGALVHVYNNVTAHRRPEFLYWCGLPVSVVNGSHLGWSANQPIDQWTRCFIPVDSMHIQALQITARDAQGNTVQGAYESYIIEAYVAYGVFYFSIEWWSRPFPLYVSLKSCDNITVISPKMKRLYR